MLMMFVHYARKFSSSKSSGLISLPLPIMLPFFLTLDLRLEGEGLVGWLASTSEIEGSSLSLMMDPRRLLSGPKSSIYAYLT